MNIVVSSLLHPRLLVRNQKFYSVLIRSFYSTVDCETVQGETEKYHDQAWLRECQAL